MELSKKLRLNSLGVHNEVFFQREFRMKLLMKLFLFVMEFVDEFVKKFKLEFAKKEFLGEFKMKLRMELLKNLKEFNGVYFGSFRRSTSCSWWRFQWSSKRSSKGVCDSGSSE